MSGYVRECDRDAEEAEENAKLARYIVEWLRMRNEGELMDAFDAMTVGDARRMREELEHILLMGKPPENWIDHR